MPQDKYYSAEELDGLFGAPKEEKDKDKKSDDFFSADELDELFGYKEKDTGSYIGDIAERIGSSALRLPEQTRQGINFMKRLSRIPGDLLKKELQLVGVNDEWAEKISGIANKTILGKYGDIVDSSARIYDVLKDTDEYKELAEVSEKLKERSDRYDKDITEYFKEKDYTRAAGAIMLYGAESLPQSLIAAFTGGAGLVSLGLMAGGEQYDSLADHEDMTETAKLINATGVGILEAATEAIGTAKIGGLVMDAFKKGGKEAAEVVVKEGLFSYIKGAYKKVGLWTAPVQEGAEEWVNAVGGNILARVTGEDDDRGLTEGANESFWRGTGGGTYFSGAGLTGQGIQSLSSRLQTEKDVEMGISDVVEEQSEEVKKKKAATPKPKVYLTDSEIEVSEDMNAVPGYVEKTDEGYIFSDKITQAEKGLGKPETITTVKEAEDIKGKAEVMVTAIDKMIESGGSVKIADESYSGTELTDLKDTYERRAYRMDKIIEDIKPIEKVEPVKAEPVKETKEAPKKPAKKVEKETVKEPVKLPEMEDGTRMSPVEIEKQATKAMSNKEYGETTVNSRKKTEVDDVTSYEYTTPNGERFSIQKSEDGKSWDISSEEISNKTEWANQEYTTRKAAEEAISKEAIANREVETKEKPAKKKATEKPKESLLADKTTAFTTFMDAPRRRKKVEIQRDEMVTFLEDTRDAEMKAAKTEEDQKKIFNDYDKKIRNVKKRFSGNKVKIQKESLSIRRKMLEEFIRDNRQDIQKAHGNVVPAMLNKINNVKTLKSLNSAMDYMEKVMTNAKAKEEAVEVTKALDSIEKLTDTKSKLFRDTKSKIAKLKDADSKAIRGLAARMDKIKSNLFTKSREQAAEEIAKIHADIQKRMDETGEDITPEEFDKIEDLMMSGIWEMNTEEIKGVESKIKELRKEARTQAKKEFIANKAVFTDQLNAWVDYLKGDKDIVTDFTKKDDPKNKIKDTYQLFDFVKNSSWFSVLDKMSKYEYRNSKETVKIYDSKLVRKFGDMVHRADNAETKGLRETVTKSQEVFERIFGKDIKAKGRARRRALSMIARENKGLSTKVFDRIRGKVEDNILRIGYKKLLGGKGEFVTTRNKLGNLWMQMQREEMYPTLEKMGIMREVEGEYELTDFGKQVDKNMSPEMKEWAEWQLDFYSNELYDRYNEAYKEQFGVDMPKGGRYVPTYRKADHVEDSVEEILLNESFIGLGQNRHLYKTTGSTKELKLMDMDDVLMTYIYKMEHFKAKAGTIKELNKFWRNPAMQETMKQVYGTNYNEVVNNFLDDYAGKMSSGKIYKEVDWLRKNFTTASLALKPAIFVKQLSSLPGYSAFLPAGQLAKGLAKFMTNPHKFWKESEFFLSRYDIGFDRDLADLMKKQTSKKLSGTQNIASDLMFLVKLGDRIPIVLGGYAVYDYNYNKSLKTTKPGTNRKYTKAEAKEIGVHEFERSTRFMQQAANVADLSFWQRGGSFAKLFTMYMTAPMSYHRLASGGLRRVVQGAKGGNWGTVRQGGKAFFIGHVLLPVVFQAVANGFSFDDEEDFKDLAQAAILGNINNLFLIGDAIEAMLDTMREKRFAYQGTPVESIVTDSKRALDEAMGAFEEAANGDGVTWEEIQDIADAVVTPASHIFGLPYPGISNLYEGIDDVIKGETDYPVRRIIGYSEAGLSSGDIDVGSKPKKYIK